MSANLKYERKYDHHERQRESFAERYYESCNIDGQAQVVERYVVVEELEYDDDLERWLRPNGDEVPPATIHSTTGISNPSHGDGAWFWLADRIWQGGWAEKRDCVDEAFQSEVKRAINQEVRDND